MPRSISTPRHLTLAPIALSAALLLCLAAVPAFAQTVGPPNGGGGSSGFPFTLGSTSVNAGATVASLAGLTLTAAPQHVIIGTAAATPTTDQTQASGGSTLLPLPNTTGVVAGQVVSGTDIPAADQVASLTPTIMTGVSFVTTSSSPSGAKVINSTNISTATLASTMQCVDTTSGHATYIGAGNVLTAVVNATSATLTSNIVTTIPIGDTISCEPVVTLTVATTTAVPVSTVVTFLPNAAALSASSALVDMADASVYGNLNVGGILNLGTPATVGSFGAQYSSSTGIMAFYRTSDGGQVITIDAATDSLKLGASTYSNLNIDWNSDTAISRASAGVVEINNAGTPGAGGTLDLGTVVLTAGTPTVSSGQLGLGTTTTANTNCGTVGTGCLAVNIGGTTRYLTYY